MPERPVRVLIEHENPRVAARQASQLHVRGFAVRVCPGPAGLEDGECPLAASGDCEMASTADVIVNELPLGRFPVFAAQRRRLPDRPVLLGLTDEERARFPALAVVAPTIPRTLDGDALAAAIRDVRRSR